MTTATDAEVLKKVVAGDRQAYGEIVRRYQATVWGVVSSTLYHSLHCEDIVQQVFVKAYFAMESFDPRREFGPWIRTIARNEVLMSLRRNDREHKHLEAYRMHLMTHLAEEDADESADVRKLRLQECIGRLAKPIASALRWRYELDLSYEEIGARMERSAEAVRVMMGRARTSLRKCIECP